MNAEIAIGSRGSALALAQSRLVHEAFEREGLASRVVSIVSPYWQASWL